MTLWVRFQICGLRMTELKWIRVVAVYNTDRRGGSNCVPFILLRIGCHGPGYVGSELHLSFSNADYAIAFVQG